jgi:inosine-uridine nucleoside N-ribohydrolase
MCLVPLGDADRLSLLSRPRPAPTRIVIDTDTGNEIDDQFALSHALLDPEAVTIDAIGAAPFHNERSQGPADGMRQSLEEIGRILDLAGGPRIPVLAGAEAWMTTTGQPVRSEAVEDLIERALAATEPLCVVAIGAATNVASALALEPKIGASMVVVWLGGHSRHWPDAREFNLEQDPAASRLLLDSGAALLLVPCQGTADRMVTTRAEIDRHVRPHGPLGAYLASLYDDFVPARPGSSDVIWDMAATAAVIEPAWVSTAFGPSPILTAEHTWSIDPARHLIAEATKVDRDAILGDFYRRLEVHAGRAGR